MAKTTWSSIKQMFSIFERILNIFPALCTFSIVEMKDNNALRPLMLLKIDYLLRKCSLESTLSVIIK